jgi:hypothetical protein
VEIAAHYAASNIDTNAPATDGATATSILENTTTDHLFLSVQFATYNQHFYS